MEITIKNLQKKIPINPKRIKEIVLKLLRLENVKKPAEITIIFVNDRKMRELNLFYSGRDNATDVISFDNSIKKNEILTDIVVSTDTALRNSRIFKTKPFYELCLYVVHGLLHILGYDDENLKQKRIMDEKTFRILSTLNL